MLKLYSDGYSCESLSENQRSRHKCSTEVTDGIMTNLYIENMSLEYSDLVECCDNFADGAGHVVGSLDS